MVEPHHATPKLKKRHLILKKEKIAEKYKVMKEDAGKGGYGFVKKAILKATNQIRAIKCIPKEAIVDMKKFKGEVDSLKNVDHPYIVKLFEWYEDHDYFYLVTEYCEGGELLTKVLEEEYFTEKKAAVYFKQILSAINHCHHSGICHRDIKAENIMLATRQPDSIIKIIDFGLAKVLEDCSDDLDLLDANFESKVGTPSYIPPEVLSGDYNYKCDLWSAGIVLYILLCGLVPFYGKTDIAIMEAIKIGKFEFDDEVWDDVSDEAKDLINKLIIDQESRLSAEEALNHPWIKNMASLPNKKFSEQQYKNLKKFRDSERLKKAVLHYMASQMSAKESHSLDELFMCLDVNGDGRLSVEEFKKGLSGVKSEEEVKSIIEAIDVDQNGYVDYNEFVAATMDASVFLNEKKILHAFNLFDVNKTGKITADELRNVIGREIPDSDDAVWDEMIKEIDTDQTGIINFNDFVKMMNGDGNPLHKKS